MRTNNSGFVFYLNEIFGSENFVADMIWAAGRKNDSRLISISHEYIVCYARDKAELKERNIRWQQRKKGLDEIYSQYAKLKKLHGDDYVAMTAGLKFWFKNLPDAHPAKSHKHYSHIDKRGVYFPDNISWPGGGGPKYEVLHPRSGKPVTVPSRGWMTSDPDKLQQWIDDDRVHFGDDEKAVPCIKSYLKDREYQAPYSVFYQDGRAATKRLRQVMGSSNFGYPKDETVISEIIGMTSQASDLVMDHFAGSGTTGHAVINLNREDGGNRKYVLVEMGDYFDTVLKPRIAKVVYSENWKNGKPVQPKDKKARKTDNPYNGISHCFKYIRLESYEDALNNLMLRDDPQRDHAIESNDSLRRDYLLNYFLDVETQGSQSLLNVDAFRDPTAYTMRIKQPGHDESREQTIDLVETFNWLVGLWVDHTAAPQRFVGEFKREKDPELPDDENTRLVCTRLKQDSQGDYWFRLVEGYTLKVPGDQQSKSPTLVIWRKLTDDPEADNAALQEYLRVIGVSTREHVYDTIYVNGSHTLPNPVVHGESTKVRLLEEAFHKAMWSEAN